MGLWRVAMTCSGNGLIRFYMEAGNGSMQVDVPEETARSIARWILDHTNA